MRKIWNQIFSIIVIFYRAYKLLNIFGFKSKKIVALFIIISFINLLLKFNTTIMFDTINSFNLNFIIIHEIFSLKGLVVITLVAYTSYLKYIFVNRCLGFLIGLPYWYKIIRSNCADSSFKPTMATYILLNIIFNIILLGYLSRNLSYIDEINPEFCSLLKFYSSIASLLLVTLNINIILKTKFQIEDAPVLYTRALFILFFSFGPLILFHFLTTKNILDLIEPIVKMLKNRSTIDLSLCGCRALTEASNNLRAEVTTDSPSTRLLVNSSSSSSAVASTSISINSTPSLSSASKIKINSLSDFEGLSSDNQLSLRLSLDREYRNFIDKHKLNHYSSHVLLNYKNSNFLIKYYFFFNTNTQFLLSKNIFLTLTLDTAIGLEIYSSIAKDPFTNQWRVPKWNHSEKELKSIAQNIAKLLFIKRDYNVDCFSLDNRLKNTDPNWVKIKKDYKIQQDWLIDQEYRKKTVLLYGRARGAWAARELSTIHTTQLAANTNLEPSSRLNNVRQIYRIEE